MKQGFEDYFVDRTTGVYPQSASGMPYSAATMAVKGDPITDLHEDMAADGTTTKEQPANHIFDTYNFRGPDAARQKCRDF